MIWANWHGGSSYAHSGYLENIETFASIRAAADALQSRARHGGRVPQTFTYADGRTERVLTPCADDGARMVVWSYDPRADDVTDPYPDRMIEFGPRGGIRVERC